MGGRWSDETAQFLHLLAKSEAASARALMRSRTRAAWLRRGGSILACVAARAFAVSLLEQGSAPGTGGDPLSEQGAARSARAWHGTDFCGVLDCFFLKKRKEENLQCQERERGLVTFATVMDALAQA